MIAAGIEWRGFAFLEVLSPCVTFRPEEFEWKNKVRHDAVTVKDDRASAVQASFADDGFSLGILFQGDELPVHAPAPVAGTLADIERQFIVP